MSIADGGFPSLNHYMIITAARGVFELSLPGLPCALQRKNATHEKGRVFSNVHTKLNIWVSLVFQRDVTMSEYNVSVATLKKKKISSEVVQN